MRNDIIDRIDWRVHRKAADSARANGADFHCAQECGFAATEQPPRGEEYAVELLRTYRALLFEWSTHQERWHWGTLEGVLAKTKAVLADEPTRKGQGETGTERGQTTKTPGGEFPRIGDEVTTENLDVTLRQLFGSEDRKDEFQGYAIGIRRAAKRDITTALARQAEEHARARDADRAKIAELETAAKEWAVVTDRWMKERDANAKAARELERVRELGSHFNHRFPDECEQCSELRGILGMW